MTDIAPWNITFNTNHKLFDWIYSLVIEEGGDGDAVIGFKFQNYKEVAKLFRELLDQSWVMEEKEDHIIFYCHQECIILTSAKHFDSIPNWGARILTL